MSLDQWNLLGRRTSQPKREYEGMYLSVHFHQVAATMSSTRNMLSVWPLYQSETMGRISIGKAHIELPTCAVLLEKKQSSLIIIS